MVYKREVLRVMLLLITIGLTGCFSSNPKDIEAFLKPHETNVTAESYVLQPPDVIEIHCSKVPEVHQQHQQIRPDGKISFEGLGEIEAAGKTPAQVANDLRTKILELYNLTGNYPIDVRVVAFRSKRIYVLGQVGTPGPQVYTGRDTVLGALALAGSPTVLAWVDRIQIIRPSSNPNVKAKIFEFDFDPGVSGDKPRG